MYITYLKSIEINKGKGSIPLPPWVFRRVSSPASPILRQYLLFRGEKAGK